MQFTSGSNALDLLHLGRCDCAKENQNPQNYYISLLPMLLHTHAESSACWTHSVSVLLNIFNSMFTGVFRLTHRKVSFVSFLPCMEWPLYGTQTCIMHLCICSHMSMLFFLKYMSLLCLANYSGNPVAIKTMPKVGLVNHIFRLWSIAPENNNLDFTCKRLISSSHHILNHANLAMQTRQRLTKKQTCAAIQKETSILQRLQTVRNVVQLLDSFEDEDECHIVTGEIAYSLACIPVVLTIISPPLRVPFIKVSQKLLTC